MKDAMAATLIIIGSFAVLFLAVWGIILASFGMRVATAGLFGAGEAHIRTQSADFRLAAYNHFFDLCASVQGNEGQLDALYQELELQAPESRDYGYTVKSITGVQGIRAQSVARYNQDVLKWTVGQFRDSDLPYHLSSPVPYDPEGSKTECAYQ